jgi:threonine efflux protein
MQSWLPLLPILGVWTLTVIAPGPDTLAVVSTALGGSRKAGLAVAAGCAVASLIWASTSLAGLALLFERAQRLYHLVRIGGALYLIVVGAALLWSAYRQCATAPSGTIATRAVNGSLVRAFRLGLLTDLSNPKAAAFFTSLFAVALPADASFELELLIVAAVGVIAGAWYALIAMTVSLSSIARLYARGRHALEAIAGLLFIGLGARLAGARLAVDR